MVATPGSPAIENIEWGRVQVEGCGSFRDARLYPGGASEWDWGESGTHHDPGILPADVQDLLDRGARVLILSKGFHDRLGVATQTMRLLEEWNVEVHILNTGPAVELYNDRCRREPVGALIHSTC
jgi:hypothetical protein